MEITTNAGTLDTETLPQTYEPCYCSRCGDRIGWMDEEQHFLPSAMIAPQ